MQGRVLAASAFPDFCCLQYFYHKDWTAEPALGKLPGVIQQSGWAEGC